MHSLALTMHLWLKKASKIQKSVCIPYSKGLAPKKNSALFALLLSCDYFFLFSLLKPLTTSLEVKPQVGSNRLHRETGEKSPLIADDGPKIWMEFASSRLLR